MPFAFPIQQIPPSEKMMRTEIVFDENEVRNDLFKDKGPTYDYLLSKRYIEMNENSQDIYMKRKLLELEQLIDSENSYSSSITDILSNPSFKAIVDFGWDIVPMILSELRFKSNCLVWAMNLITGIKISDKKVSLSEASKLWVEWGKKRGYIK